MKDNGIIVVGALIFVCLVIIGGQLVNVYSVDVAYNKGYSYGYVDGRNSQFEDMKKNVDINRCIGNYEEWNEMWISCYEFGIGCK